MVTEEVGVGGGTVGKGVREMEKNDPLCLPLKGAAERRLKINTSERLKIYVVLCTIKLYLTSQKNIPTTLYYKPTCKQIQNICLLS